MTLIELQTRITAIRNELETRHKYGAVKIADADGVAVPTEKLQAEMYSLIYKKSKLLNSQND